MLFEPSGKQLQHREADPTSAKMAYAVDSGQGRMRSSSTLYKELLKLNDPETDLNVLPSHYQALVEEIKNEIPFDNNSKVIQRFLSSINQLAKLNSCACCGRREYEMNGVCHHEVQIDKLSILQYSSKQINDLEIINLPYR